MRLLLLPISTRRALIYCEPPSHSLPAKNQGYIDKGVNYASKTWAEWEKSDTKWKLKTTELGNKMLRRIPYEEWGLKSIPALRKKLKEDYVNDPQKMRVDVEYPGLYQGLAKESVLDMCKRLSTERQGLHRKTLYYSVAGMPLTIPFGLIPVVPNLPFLYLLFRAYSHWRALNGSQHLEYLANNKLLAPKPSGILDTLYSAGILHATREDSNKAKEPTLQQGEQIVSLIRKQIRGESLTKSASLSSSEVVEIKPPPVAESQPPKTDDREIMLLKGWNGKLIAEKLELPGLQVEIERAVEQVENSLRKDDEKKQEKEQEAAKAVDAKAVDAKAADAKAADAKAADK